MTMCNMTIEWRRPRRAWSRPTTRRSRGSTAAPARRADFDAAVERWRALRTEDGASFDREVVVDAGGAQPDGDAGGRTPARSSASPTRCPSPRTDGERARAAVHGAARPARRSRRSSSTASSSARARTRASATCAPRRRWSRAARSRATSTRWSSRAPCRSSCRPRPRASTRSSSAAGFDWRGAGCSMCLGMNPDILEPGERCASTSNRNFEGRQGRGGRTHLVSPEMAAAAAIEGHFVDIRDWS